ncbi:hypothetical protein RIF29_21018 [Crotalaria pallida]|uniref:Probable purine permease n=1 Tax=Crotalaria pallida TaxID=3830 RepID=A0AAN9F6N2_CROPI
MREEAGSEAKQDNRTMKRILLIINCIMLATGVSGGPLVIRLYFIHGGNRVWLSSFLQGAGFPLILIPLSISYIIRRHCHLNTHAADSSELKMVTMKPPLFAFSAIIGVVTGLDSYLYSAGVARLPVSTSALILSTQLAFTALFAFFMAIPREARHYELGEATYYVVLVGSAILWQINFLGTIGVIFGASSLLSGIMIALMVPITELLYVIIYKEKFKAEKGVSLVLSVWGFVSYFYGDFKQAKQIEMNPTLGNELPQNQTWSISNVRGELLSEYSMTYEFEVEVFSMSVISFGYKLWEGDVTLKDEVCQMLGYVRCKKWSVIDAVGNTHEIRIQQLRAGGKLAITDGLDNIMEFYNLTNSRHLINLMPISRDTFKIVIYDNGDEIQYQQQYTETFLHPICKCRWCRSAGQTFQFDCEVEITVNRNQAERSILPLPESFVATALPLSSGEHYLVDEDNVEHPVELVRSIRNLNEAYLMRNWFDFCVVFHIVAGSTIKLAVVHAHQRRIYFFRK